VIWARANAEPGRPGGGRTRYPGDGGSSALFGFSSQNIHTASASASYVTGSHNFKVGFADSFGPIHVFTDRQADLVQTYNNGRPTSVTVYTTPYNRFSYVNYDLGMFAQARSAAA